jgi:hypothetical protein
LASGIYFTKEDHVKVVVPTSKESFDKDDKFINTSERQT